MTKMNCKECKESYEKRTIPCVNTINNVQMKLQLRSERGEGVYWCPQCGTVCKTVVVAKDPTNEKIIAWESPTLEMIY